MKAIKKFFLTTSKKFLILFLKMNLFIIFFINKAK
jgi:hypothetical protein